MVSLAKAEDMWLFDMRYYNIESMEMIGFPY